MSTPVFILTPMQAEFLHNLLSAYRKALVKGIANPRSIGRRREKLQERLVIVDEIASGVNCIMGPEV